MNKKLLYIGPIRQADGWGRASRDILKSLMTIKGLDIAMRPIYMGMTRQEIEEELSSLEKNSFDSYDYIIQNVLPNYLFYDRRFKKNIGLSFFEMRDLGTTGWVERINLMDEYLVCTEQEKLNLEESGASIPIHVIGPATDCDKYFRSYDNIIPNNKNFKFYFIGEFINRKNLRDTIIAFHNEFAINENVDLVIKTNIPGIEFQEVERILHEFIDSVKKTMRIYPTPEHYKKELLILENLDDETICKLHACCDCFVCASYGESICKPALDALGFGNTPIVTSNTGMTTFVNKDNGYVVPSYNFPVFSENGTGLPNVYTSAETWQQINVSDLQTYMRYAFSARNNNPKSTQGKADIMNYSFEKSGQKINEVLCQ